MCFDNIVSSPTLISVGSYNDFSFEEAILERFPSALIHTYDHTSLPSNNPRIDFRKQAMTPQLLRGILSYFIKKNTSIDILKVDCEGCESELFSNPLILKRLRSMNTQILIEVHWKALKQKGVYTLWKHFHRAGFAPFHKEANIMYDPSCVEYSLI